MELTVSQYAKSKNISRQSVDQTIAKHKAELKSLIREERQGKKKTRYLSEDAQKILDIYCKFKEEAIQGVQLLSYDEQLKAENDNLKLAVMQLQNKVISLQDEVNEFQALQLESEKTKFLLQEANGELTREREKVSDLEQKLDTLQKRNLWQRIWNK